MIMMRSGLVGTPRCGASCLASSGTRATSAGFLVVIANAVTPSCAL